MSLYNMLHGKNPIADMLLAMINLTGADVGRYRDYYLNELGTEICVYTRNGGGNREGYMPDFSGHPYFLRDADDDFDCTYATLYFAVPPEFAGVCKQLADQSDTRTGAQKFEQLMSDLDAGKDNASVSRALGVGKKIIDPISGHKTGPITTLEGGIVMESFPKKETP